MNEFKNFGLSENIIKALDHVGFTTPTEIQQKAIPMLVSGENKDFHGQAQTGTGKTLAFGIPLVHKVDVSKKGVQALVIAPTRELVLQIVESLAVAAKFCKGLSIVPIYGGVDITRQISQLRKGVHIVVGTPGRVNDHIRRKNLKLHDLQTLVLDEADTMLDMGFRQDIEFILSKMPQERKIWLFSATNKRGVDDLKKSHMKDPVSVRVVRQNVANSNTEQYFCVSNMKYRFQVLCRIIDKEPEFYGIIFCQTKLLCADIASKLSKKGYNAGSLHGDMDQKMRNKVIQKFKKRDCEILVATDVAARGIDVNDLTHVVNYSLPEDQDSYVHRVGRTGRAGKKGVAITFISSREVRIVNSLSRKFGIDIKKFNVPSLKDLVGARVGKAIEYFNNSSKGSCEGSGNLSSTLNGVLDPLKSAIKELPKDELVDVAINLLSDKFLKEYENAEEIPTSSLESDYGSGNSRSFGGRGRDRARGGRGRGREKGSSQRYEQGPDMSEIVLHVGSEDGVERHEIMAHVLNSRAIDRKYVERVRVIRKRSFVVVPSKFAKKVVSALNGKKIQSKKVRVGIARF
ncbi:DEAD/DEAH box helicase [Candidatus Dependentiae bacterium]